MTALTLSLLFIAIAAAVFFIGGPSTRPGPLPARVPARRSAKPRR